MPPPPGMATYTDKLFKLRNGRWEDILSDEVNRDVASRFAGRSVACVDRTVSRQGSAYKGISAPFPLPVPLQWSPGGPFPLPIPAHPQLGLGVPPSCPLTVRAGNPRAVETVDACLHGCHQLINVPVGVIYVPVTCSFFVLLLQRFVSK